MKFCLLFTFLLVLYSQINIKSLICFPPAHGPAYFHTLKWFTLYSKLLMYIGIPNFQKSCQRRLLHFLVNLVHFTKSSRQKTLFSLRCKYLKPCRFIYLLSVQLCMIDSILSLTWIFLLVRASSASVSFPISRSIVNIRTFLLFYTLALLILRKCSNSSLPFMLKH